jgi:hypothetical protein
VRGCLEDYVRRVANKIVKMMGLKDLDTARIVRHKEFRKQFCGDLFATWVEQCRVRRPELCELTRADMLAASHFAFVNVDKYAYSVLNKGEDDD